MAQYKALAEVPEDIHHLGIHQEVGRLMALGVLGLPYVGIKVSHQIGDIVPELYQVLLQV